jgi:hypothetical protein
MEPLQDRLNGDLQGQFGSLKHLLLDGSGVLTVEYDTTVSNLTVRIDRDKLFSHGQPARVVSFAAYIYGVVLPM